MSAELSRVESGELARHEAVIEKGLTTFIDVGNALLAIKDGKLYRDVFMTFEEYCSTRWNMHRSRAYRFIDAAEVVNNLRGQMSPIGDIPRNEAQARPLAALPPADQPAAWEEAVEQSNGKPTARAVQEAVDRRLGKPEPRTQINGVATIDPPDVAKLRANGKIPADAVVEVREAEPAPDDAPAEPFEPGAGPGEDATDDSDESFLLDCPARKSLGPVQLRIFDADAILYRRLDEHRRKFQHHATRAMNAAGRRGEFAFRLAGFLRLDHPRDWIVCPAPEFGGCAGAGEVPLVGKCPKCFGRGYRIK